MNYVNYTSDNRWYAFGDEGDADVNYDKLVSEGQDVFRMERNDDPQDYDEMDWGEIVKYDGTLKKLLEAIRDDIWDILLSRGYLYDENEDEILMCMCDILVNGNTVWEDMLESMIRE